MRVTITFALLLTLFASACSDGLNIGSPPPRQVEITDIVPPSNIEPGSTGSFVVNFIGVSGPFTSTYSFTGGVIGDEEVQHVLPSGTTTDSIDVTFVDTGANELEETLTVTIVDASAAVATLTNSFTVPASIELREPSITDIAIMDATPLPGAPVTQTLTVNLAGTPGLVATVIVEPPLEVAVEPAGRTIIFDEAGAARAQFEVELIAVFGDNVSLNVTVDGPLPLGGHDEELFTFTASASFQPADDTLYAIPLKRTVRIGENVRVLIVTGPTANPFLYLTGARLAVPVESDVDYVWQSMNYGAPGGEPDYPDGIWAMLGTDYFLIPDGIDFWINPNDNFMGYSVLDLNITPLGADEMLGAEGPLCNFEIKFNTGGTWQLGFKQFNTVPRTYYQDSNQAQDHFWSDISNDHPGIPNSVTVVP